MSSGAASPPRQVVVRAWMIACLLGSGAFATARFAARALPAPRPLEELAYYPSGRHLRYVTLGQSEAVADLAWLRAIQYYGEHRMSDNRFARMEHVFDILTSLAPRFVPAYRFGGFALAQEGRDFEAAERLMLKGIEANPSSGVLAFDLGFLYYVRPGGRELPRAAEYFEQAARLEDAPPSAARFAAYARQHSGSLLVAYELWSTVLETSPNEYLREAARREMELIRSAVKAGRAERAMRRLTTPQVVIKQDP